MKAVLLAAGRGSRLAPLTDSVPKILAPISGRPLLEYQLSYLEQQGVTEIALNVSHHADQVLAYLEGTAQPNVSLISLELELLGTAGALVPLQDFLTHSVVVLYGDVVTTVSLTDLMTDHTQADSLATLAYYESGQTKGKGVLQTTDDGQITSFVEKTHVSARAAKVNAGVFVVTPAILEFIESTPSDFGYDIWPAVLAVDGRLHGHHIRGYVLDIGSPEALRTAEADLESGCLRW